MSTTLEQYFDRLDTPTSNSPVGALIKKILAKYPEMEFDAARWEANRLLEHAAGKRRYHLPVVLSPEEKAAKEASLRLLASARARTPEFAANI